MWRMRDAIPIGHVGSVGGEIRHENGRTAEVRIRFERAATGAGGRAPEQRSAHEWGKNPVETKVAHDLLPRSSATPSLRRDVGEHRRTERLVRLLRPAALVDELSIGERVAEPAGGD